LRSLASGEAYFTAEARNLMKANMMKAAGIKSAIISHFVYMMLHRTWAAHATDERNLEIHRSILCA
jgi:hypothetical protein